MNFFKLIEEKDAGIDAIKEIVLQIAKLTVLLLKIKTEFENNKDTTVFLRQFFEAACIKKPWIEGIKGKQDLVKLQDFLQVYLLIIIFKTIFHYLSHLWKMPVMKSCEYTVFFT